MPAIQSFLESVEMGKPSANSIINPQAQQTLTNETVPDKFTFTTTNFDEGWMAKVETDWVRVTKGIINVLLHFAKEGTTVAADPEPHIINAWNILVATLTKD
jgi:hypothetical protein